MRKVWWIGVVLFLAGLGGPAAHAQDGGDEAERRAQQLFVRAMTQSFLDNFDRARDLYEQALQLTPGNPTLLAALGETYEALGDGEKALYYAAQARDLAPDVAHFYHMLAEMELRIGRVAEAAATYEALLEHFPDDFAALQELADLQALLGRPQEALATYEALIERAGDDPRLRRQMLNLYFRLGDQAGTRTALEALIRLDASDPAPWRLLGQLYLQQNQPAEALGAFEEAYAVDPGDFETVLALADVYRQLGQGARADSLLEATMVVEGAGAADLIARAAPLYQRAEADAEAAEAAARLLERAVMLAPENADALLMLGDLRFQQGAFGEAGDLLARALDQNPRDPHLWHRAAEAYLEARRPDAARRLADDGLLLFPGQLPLLRASALALLALGRPGDALDRLAEALAVVQEDAATRPDERAAVLATCGLVHHGRGDFGASDDFFEQALAADPESRLALISYATRLAERGARLDEARRLARRAADLAPQDPQALDALGWVFFQQENFEAAKTWLGKAAAQPGASATVFEHLGDVHARLGDRTAAEQAWEAGLRLDPTRESLLERLERQKP